MTNACLQRPAILVVTLFVLALTIRRTRAECSAHQFKCKNNICIPVSWQCDEHDDCKDGSDEEGCKIRTCSETEFLCNNKKCIPDRWHCDREDDCEDNSDEDPVLCQNKTCSADQFICGKLGECISLKWRCDGQEDCSDGSDEKDCVQVTCTQDEFTCHSAEECITKRWLCDQDKDCADGSDEMNCPNVTCSSTEFMCQDGKCIPDKWYCDGGVDCIDGSDEVGCTTTFPPICSSAEFMCANRKDCILLHWQCDGGVDCPDYSDETNCTNTCRPDLFQCTDRLCIPGKLQCNGEKECQDGSDEENCPEISPKCNNKTHFDCGNNHCIPLELVCNGKNDCGQYEDEPLHKCNRNECAVNNGGCMENCVDTPTSYYCTCNKGYKLVDNFTCDNIDECQIPGSCSQNCIDTKGHFKCECSEGYSLVGNTRCKATDNDVSLLLANRHDIRKIDLLTKEYTSVISNLRSTIAVDYIYSRKLIVWCDVNEEVIKIAHMDNVQAPTVIVSNEIRTPDGIAVDWIHNLVYWVDTGRDTVEVTDLDGKMRKTLFNLKLDEPRAVAVDPRDGWLFWSDWGEPGKIERAGMDGFHRNAIITTDIEWPNGLAIDYVDRRIFWVDAKLFLMSSADYDGSNRRVIISNPAHISHPFSLDVFEDYVYWTDWASEGVHRVNKFTGKDITDIVKGLFSPMDIHVYHSMKQPAGINYCEEMNGHCSHLCLPSAHLTNHSANYSCACPNGKALMEDQRTCADTSVLIYPTSTSTTTIIIPTISVTANSSQHPNSETFIYNTSVEGKSEERSVMRYDTGMLAGIVIGVVGGLAILISLVIFCVYKQYLKRNITSMNFDNPVYRKTTEDQFSLEKNQYQPARSYPPSLEPLTSPGTNEFV